MDTNGDGQIDESEFVRHFQKALSSDKTAFEKTITQFEEVARYCANNAREKAKQRKEREGQAAREALRQEETAAKAAAEAKTKNTVDEVKDDHDDPSLTLSEHCLNWATRLVKISGAETEGRLQFPHRAFNRN